MAVSAQEHQSPQVRGRPDVSVSVLRHADGWLKRRPFGGFTVHRQLQGKPEERKQSHAELHLRTPVEHKPEVMAQVGC